MSKKPYRCPICKHITAEDFTKDIDIHIAALKRLCEIYEKMLLEQAQAFEEIRQRTQALQEKPK